MEFVCAYFFAEQWKVLAIIQDEHQDNLTSAIIAHNILEGMIQLHVLVCVLYHDVALHILVS